MTVKRLREEMPNNEFHQWRAFYHWRRVEQEKAARQQQQKAKGPRRR